MKKTLPLLAATLALAAFAPAQTLDLKGSLSRLGGTYLYDPAARRPVLALTYKAATLTDVLGRKGLDLDVSAIGGASGGGASLGMGLLWSREIPFRLSSEIGGKVALSVGPALLYATGGGKMRLGAVLGLGFRL